MDVKQIYSLMNTVSQEVLGENALVQEDLTGVVDLGTAVFNANAVDRYVKSLVNHTSKLMAYLNPLRNVLDDIYSKSSLSCILISK